MNLVMLTCVGYLVLFMLSCSGSDGDGEGVSFNDRDGYENRVAAAIRQIELEADKLEDQADHVGEERSEELLAQADTLRAARDDLHNYYELLKTAQTEPEWNEARALIEQYEETYPEISRFICCA